MGMAVTEQGMVAGVVAMVEATADLPTQRGMKDHTPPEVTVVMVEDMVDMVEATAEEHSPGKPRPLECVTPVRINAVHVKKSVIVFQNLHMRVVQTQRSLAVYRRKQSHPAFLKKKKKKKKKKRK